MSILITLNLQKLYLFCGVNLLHLISSVYVDDTCLEKEGMRLYTNGKRSDALHGYTI